MRIMIIPSRGTESRFIFARKFAAMTRFAKRGTKKGHRIAPAAPLSRVVIGQPTISSGLKK
jgi:hypothetical protein